MTANDGLPPTGFVRIKVLLGDPKADPPVLGILPLSKSAFWRGVKEGRYPAPHYLSPKTPAWAVEDIRRLIADLKASAKP